MARMQKGTFCVFYFFKFFKKKLIVIFINFEIQNYGYFELQLNGFFSGDFKIIFDQVFVAMALAVSCDVK